MHIELVETLRCPRAHEETWLVAVVTRFDGRDIVQGTLGCPSCRAEYPVRDGEVDFSGVNASAASAPVVSGEEGDEAAITPDELLRARALLGLGDSGGVVLLGGAASRFGEALEREAQVAVLLFNPPRTLRQASRHPSALRTDGTLPVAGGALRAAWFDAETATAAMLAAAARALRPGGRLMAPVASAIPAGVRELARDDREWVGEGVGVTTTPIPLRRGRG